MDSYLQLAKGYKQVFLKQVSNETEKNSQNHTTFPCIMKQSATMAIENFYYIKYAIDLYNLELESYKVTIFQKYENAYNNYSCTIRNIICFDQWFASRWQ